MHDGLLRYPCTCCTYRRFTGAMVPLTIMYVSDLAHNVCYQLEIEPKVNVVVDLNALQLRMQEK